MKTAIRLAAASLVVAWCAGHWAFGNGGPFVVKYPNGDPAAKGVLARLDPTLKPARETRLRVLKEDLTIRFVPNPQPGRRGRQAAAAGRGDGGLQYREPDRPGGASRFRLPDPPRHLPEVWHGPVSRCGVQVDKDRV